jgi:hypothetical protein
VNLSIGGVRLGDTGGMCAAGKLYKDVLVEKYSAG